MLADSCNRPSPGPFPQGTPCANGTRSTKSGRRLRPEFPSPPPRFGMITNMPAMTVRARLLNAGVALLREQGLAALTQPRIAKAAGVSQSHLTYYFPTRDSLLLAIAEHSVDQELARAQTTPAPDDPVLALVAAIRFLPRVRMMLGLIASGDRDEAFRPAFGRLVDHVRESLARLLAHRGHTLDSSQVALVHAAVVGLAVMNLGRQTAASEAEIESGLRQLLALLPPPSPPERSSP